MGVTDNLVPFTPSGYPSLEDGAKLWAVNNYNDAANSLTVLIETMRKLEAATSPVGHTHTISDVTGLQAALDSKASNVEDYLVKTASAGLSAERVVTDTATLAWDWATAGQAKANVPNDAITYAKLQNVSATSRVLGRKTTGAGDAEEITLTELLDFIGSAAQGDILFRGASGWARLAAGTSGNFLKTQGASADPTWDAVSSGGLTRITEVAHGGGTTLTVTGLGGYKVLWVTFRGVSHNSGTAQAMTCAVSGNGGSSFGTPLVTSISQTGTVTYSGSFYITNADQTNNQQLAIGSMLQDGGTTVDTSSRGPIDALQFAFASGASFDAGTFVIYGMK
jgi:hypothetical protein